MSKFVSFSIEESAVYMYIISRILYRFLKHFKKLPPKSHFFIMHFLQFLHLLFFLLSTNSLYREPNSLFSLGGFLLAFFFFILFPSSRSSLLHLLMTPQSFPRLGTPDFPADFFILNLSFCCTSLVVLCCHLHETCYEDYDKKHISFYHFLFSCCDQCMQCMIF